MVNGYFDGFLGFVGVVDCVLCVVSMLEVMCYIVDINWIFLFLFVFFFNGVEEVFFFGVYGFMIVYWWKDFFGVVINFEVLGVSGLDFVV